MTETGTNFYGMYLYRGYVQINVCKKRQCVQKIAKDTNIPLTTITNNWNSGKLAWYWIQVYLVPTHKEEPKGQSWRITELGGIFGSPNLQ
jgi:hypothetical protein